MNNILTNLWNGDISPIEKFEVNNSEIRDITRLMSRNSEKLEESLTKSQKEIFEKYINCVDEYLSLATEQAFCKGFSLSCKLLISALNTNT